MVSPEQASRIESESGAALRPASPEALSQLRSLGVPGSVMAFYERFEPSACAEIDGVRLWPIADVLEENRDYIPGADISAHGFIVFATTTFGDAYCLDLAEQSSRVVLMSHDVHYSEMARVEIAKYAKPIASNFDDFIASFIVSDLEQEPFDEPASFCRLTKRCSGRGTHKVLARGQVISLATVGALARTTCRRAAAELCRWATPRTSRKELRDEDDTSTVRGYHLSGSGRVRRCHLLQLQYRWPTRRCAGSSLNEI